MNYSFTKESWSKLPFREDTKKGEHKYGAIYRSRTPKWQHLACIYRGIDPDKNERWTYELVVIKD